MATPGETPSPCRMRSPLGLSRSWAASVFSVFIEAAADQLGKRGDRALGLGAGGAQLDGGAGTSRKHHQPHDRSAGDGSAVLGHHDFGIEFVGELDEARCGARVQPALIADGDGASDRVGTAGAGFLAGLVAHPRASASSCEATLMYFRPASCAPRTAFARVSFCRKLASLISIGRLMPAITSILALSF